ncbi:MAG TPA: hypothetical protein VE225_02045, partial [Rubrobacteraceae bacterium]|nr:hypothetical protein [Rubrobacteraceae bacterium]
METANEALGAGGLLPDALLADGQASRSGANGLPGVPDFTGVETDRRLIELWVYRKSKGTKKTYLYDLGSFTRFVGGRPVRSVTLSDLQEYASSPSEA